MRTAIDVRNVVVHPKNAARSRRMTVEMMYTRRGTRSLTVGSCSSTLVSSVSEDILLFDQRWRLLDKVGFKREWATGTRSEEAGSQRGYM